ADSREVILHGFGTEDSHHAIHAFTWGPDGGLYFQEGTFHHSQVETAYGPVRLFNAGVFRYVPDRFHLEVFVSYPFANPWGHVFDKWGQNFIADASGGSNYFGTAITGYAPYLEKRSGMKVFTTVVRPTAGCEIVSSRHFPDEAQGNFLVNNTIGFQGIKQHRVIEEGSGFTSEEIEPLLYSSDINFRPVDIEFGPDGALYIADWFNPLIGHMQYSLRDPRRDHGHGRIWRITHKGSPLQQPLVIAGATVKELIQLLSAYEDRTRYHVRIELRSRDHAEVLRELKKWVDSRDKSDPNYEHDFLEALWVHQILGDIDRPLLNRVLESSEPRARAAATRVVRFWRNDLNDSVTILERMVNDDFPRTRLEALLGLSYVNTTEAAQIALQALNHEMDYYLDYVLSETIKTLKPQWMRLLEEGTFLDQASPKLAQYLIDKVPTGDLQRFRGSPAVNYALLTRPGVAAADRQAALSEISKSNTISETEQVLRLIEEIDANRTSDAGTRIKDLGGLLLQRTPEELKAVRDRLAALVTDGESSAARRYAFAGIAKADGDPAEVWKLASAQLHVLADAAQGVALIPDAGAQAALYPKVAELLKGLPEETARSLGTDRVRYIRIDLPGKNKVLGIAELEVISNGVNIAPKGTVSQSSTQDTAAAVRAVDGKTSGRYADFATAQTVRGDDPWIELDLGDDRQVDKVRVWNRTDPGAAAELNGFALAWLDKNREAVLAQSGLEAPAESASYDPASLLRTSAIEALSSLGGHDAETFASLAPFIADAAYRDAVIETLSRLDSASWEAASAMYAADTLVKLIEAAAVDQLSTEPMRLAADFAGSKLLPILSAPDRDAFAPRLRRRAVAVVDIKPVPHQMIFDTLKFSVERGRPVEIRFQNADIMPHNLVVTAPGALEKVGMAAERMVTDPEAEKKFYVPNLPEVLWSTKLVYPGSEEPLVFVAPDKTGDYPFVCTFPGHWLIMNGIMRVVESQENVVDVERREGGEVKGTHRHFVKMWTLQDLIPNVAKIKTGRSYDKGRDLFKEAGCFQCHAIKGQGMQTGPELTKIAEKYNGVELLNQIINPSEAVDELFESFVVETNDFFTYSGFIVEQNDKEVRLRTNPLDPDDIKVIPRNTIDKIETSTLSAMPTGLLTTLQEDDIYDLVAYILSGDNADDPAFNQ
ncbi:MAG: c-type cytochrome, partial [Candidatus Hydrogenedentota bacterium]